VLLDEIADRVTLLRNASASGTLTCAGDGVDASCPCANALSGGSGCPNSVSALGARLVASGDPAQDTLALGRQRAAAASLAVFLCGDVLQAPLLFGDGLTCAGGNLHRFGQHDGASRRDRLSARRRAAALAGQRHRTGQRRSARYQGLHTATRRRSAPARRST
jgi:hypothetical protein